MFDKKNKGFTLIEILAVIIILSILMIISIPIIIDIMGNVKYETLKSEAATIERAIATKLTLNSQYDISKINISNINTELNIKHGEYDAIGIEKDNDTIIVTLMKDNYVVSYSGEATINNAKVYGLSWDGEDTFIRTDDAATLATVNVGIGNIDVVNDFDTAEIYKDMEEVIEDGEYFIKLPKFFIKKTVTGDVWTWQVSKVPKDKDYYLPSCFVDETNGIIYPYILIGKYNASLNDNKLESKPNTVPLVYANINDFRMYAMNAGEGYQLLDIHALDALQTLFIIEFAKINSQEVMAGYTYGMWYEETNTIISANEENQTIIVPSSVASGMIEGQMIDIETIEAKRNIAKNLKIESITKISDTNYEIQYEMVEESVITGSIGEEGQFVRNAAYFSGTTINVKAPSGSMVSNTNGEYAMKYRGIENLYGNIWQFIDGVNIQNNQAYVSKKAEKYASNKFDDSYVKVGYKNAETSNYIGEMGFDSNNPFINLPVSIKNSNDSKYKDFYYQDINNRVMLYGGSWSSRTYAGLFAMNLNSTSNIGYAPRGGRIMKTPY